MIFRPVGSAWCASCRPRLGVSACRSKPSVPGLKGTRSKEKNDRQKIEAYLRRNPGHMGKIVSMMQPGAFGDGAPAGAGPT